MARKKNDLLDASRNDDGNDGDAEEGDEMVCRWHERVVCLMQLEMMTGKNKTGCFSYRFSIRDPRQ